MDGEMIIRAGNDSLGTVSNIQSPLPLRDRARATPELGPARICPSARNIRSNYFPLLFQISILGLQFIAAV